MSGEPTPPDLCEYCHKRAPRLRVKHPDTCRHWRCLECARDLMTDAGITVTGWALPTRSHAVGVNRVNESHAADMLRRGCAGCPHSIRRFNGGRGAWTCDKLDRIVVHGHDETERPEDCPLTISDGEADAAGRALRGPS